MLEKAIEMEWEALQNQQEATRKKLEDAEKIVDGVNQLDRWLHGKQRLIDSVGAPSTDSHMAKGQRAQIDMLKIDTENERLNMEKLKDLAEKLGDSATNDGDKEIIQKQIDLLNDRWGSLNDGLEKKESNISRAAELGAEIAQINKEIKKKLGELEHEVDAVSRLPSTEINQQLSKLDELKRREGEVNELLEKLGEKVKKADEYAVDSTNQTEIAEGLLNAKTKTAELDKKIDSVKQAALSVKDQGDLLDRHVDGLLDSIQLLALDINNSPPICADKEKLFDEISRFSHLYDEILGKEGDVNDLVKQFIDQEATLKNHLVGDEQGLAKAQEEAQGPDARHLKRGAENLCDDVRALSKKARNGLAAVQKKIDLRTKFDKLIDESTAFAEGKEAELEKDKEMINRERLQAKLSEVESFWGKTGRELKQLGQDLKQILPDEAHQSIDLPIEELGERFEGLIEKMRLIDLTLNEKRKEAENVKEKTIRLATRLNSLYSDLNDLDPIGRSLDELQKQNEQCDEMNAELNERESELNSIYDLWKSALNIQAVTPEQLATNQQHLDDMKRLIAKGKRKIGDRFKKIGSIEEDLKRIENESKAVIDDVNRLAEHDALKNENGLTDPKTRAEELRQLKDQLRPVSERADSVQAECKALIKTASPDADTKQLSSTLAEVSRAVDGINASIGAKQLALDAAVQQMGSYNDAQRDLQNWLEETEELVGNQKMPSSDAKVAKAQLQSYDVLLKHIEDKETSVDGFRGMIGKLANIASNDDEKKVLSGKADEITNRYEDLLEGAQKAQARLRDTVDLAEKFTHELAPFEQWLQQVEKKIGQLGNVPTDSERLGTQIHEVEEIRDEIDKKNDVVDKICQLGPALASLVSVEDAGELEAQIGNATAKHGQLAERAEQCHLSLHAMGELISDFEQDMTELATWLDQIEQDMAGVEELPINPEELVEQTNLLSELVESVTERDALVANVVRVGKTLCKATTADEALALQGKIDGLKNRYVAVANYADEKLGQLSKAIPLSDRFHEGIERVMEWVEAVEDDLRHIDSVDLDTQQQLIHGIDEDVTQWRPEVEELVAVSSQLQQLAGPERAEELYAHTQEMQRRVNLIADQVGRRAERLDLAERQSRAVVEELEFVLEWLNDAKERVMNAAPLAIDPDYLKAQLRNQKLLNEDLSVQKARLRDATAECRKVARQIGPEGGQDALLLEKAEGARELADEVSHVCAERTEALEQALALAEQIGASFDDMSIWLDQVEDELANQPAVTTATPPHELSKQQQHNIELSAVIAAQRPLVERFEKDVRALVDLVGQEDAVALEQIYDQIVGRFQDVQKQVKERGEGIDSILDVTEAFGNRLDVFLATLEGAAESLRQPAAVSADPGLLQNRIAENEALLDSLKDKENALAAMKERAAELLARAQPGDDAASEVAAKIQALEQLWNEIGDGAQMRGAFLQDALAKANLFWNELDNCQKAIDDLKARLETIEPAIGQPEKIREQQNGMIEIEKGVQTTKPRIENLRYAGAALLAIIPEEEQTAVEQQVDMIDRGFDTITKMFADKSVHLGKAMEQAMGFHEDLAALNEFLDSAEQRLQSMGPAEQMAVHEIQPRLEELQLFRIELDDHAMLKEQINQTAQGLVAGAPAHQTAAVRIPIAELNGRWSRLYGDIADREHKIERAMLEMGRLGEAVGQLTAWIDKTQSTIDELGAHAPTNLRAVEIAQCKLAVVNNDIHAHEPSIKSINASASKLRQSSDPSTLKEVMGMNEKWKNLQESIGSLGAGLERAKGAAEDIGGEMERWLAYVEDVEAQLATTKPTGGLPETAKQHLEDFLGLKDEIEGNTPALEAHVVITEDYLTAHPEDEGSWIGKSAHTLRHKWNRCKDLLLDREKKLSLALEEAIALEESMQSTSQWVTNMEEALAAVSPIGRLPEVLERQKDEQQHMADEVNEKKAAMAEMQATGTRMQYYCEKKDAIPIKNGLVSLRHRFEKVAQKVAERGKQLDSAQAETDAWLESAKDLEFWMAEMGVKLEEEIPTTANHHKLLELRDEAKEAKQELIGKKPEFEAVRRRGQSVGDHAPKTERKEIEKKNGQLKKDWDQLEKVATDRLRKAEEAVLESGAFDDAIEDIEAWIDAMLLDAETDSAMAGTRVHGDIDTVRDLIEKENKRGDEKAAKKKQVDKLLKKADELIERGVDEKDDVRESKKRLQEKWEAIEAAANARADALRMAKDEAEDFDAKAHALLSWMDEKDEKLRVNNKEPNLDKAIDVAQGVVDEMKFEEPRKEALLALCAAIQTKAHPAAEQPMRHWNKLLTARWKEVEDRALEKTVDLKEQKQKNEEREKALKELLAFVAKKRDQLLAMSSAPTPEDLTTVDNMLQAYEQLDFELNEKQPEVDDAVKGGQKAKNPKAIQLGDEWKRLWLDALGHKNALDETKELLEEMKRLEGWQWEDWKERYCEWNDHAKGRVTDLFRRIDRTATGNVPRQAFIDAIINSRFPTSRLEMEKVADLFDKDAFINHKDFINALRFDKNRRAEPKSDNERIAIEIDRQVRGCACCQPYKIEKISDGHYRFGDTQIRRMVRILRSTVMVRVGGGWVTLEEFLRSHDPCRAIGRRYQDIYPDVRPSNAVDTMRAFTKNRHARMSSTDSDGAQVPPGALGPITKIREKTERSFPMFPHGHDHQSHAHNGSSSSVSKLRAPSDVSLGDSRIGKGWPGGISPAGSQSSLDRGSRPPSRASADPERSTRIPSLRGKKGVRYNPPRQL
ncbi:unnamed protein product, partial [Mesorhabditis belari]|uniref:GAR domain-containing protein n=1 Tax=Mesorhabditis belari TaxID=2138241 RepID=A0AAF3FD94_9BILA